MDITSLCIIFDSVDVAGILLGDAKELPKTYKERENCARTFLKEYTQWCNGECFWYGINEITKCKECGQKVEKPVDSCGGFIGSDFLIEHLKSEYGDILENAEFTGEAAYLMQ